MHVFKAFLAVLLAIAAIGLGWAFLSGKLTTASLHAGPHGTAGGDCTPDQPCEVRLLFTATDNAARAMPDGLLARVAADDVQALREAFARSGITRVEGGRPSIIFAPPTILERPVDAGRINRVDTPAGWGDPVGFNQRMLRWLPTAERLKGPARQVNIVVVFSGLQGRDGECWANAVAGSGYLTIPGCLLNGYARDPRVAWNHRIMFLHEAGHLFGAFHNDNGDPQPCRAAGHSGMKATSCAWEQCTGRTCSAKELQFATDAFCTLVGQYNFNRGPNGESYCRAHRGGENGSGWILEYSHPGKCRTPGFEAYDCGDAGHDQVSVMTRRAWFVSRQRPVVD